MLSIDTGRLHPIKLGAESNLFIHVRLGFDYHLGGPEVKVAVLPRQMCVLAGARHQSTPHLCSFDLLPLELEIVHLRSVALSSELKFALSLI